MSNNKSAVFTWRPSQNVECVGAPDGNYYSETFRYWMGSKSARPNGFCPYCTGDVSIFDHAAHTDKSGFRHYFHEKHVCNLCGFWCEINDYDHGMTNHVTMIQRSMLQQFNINDAALEYKEIGSHLNNNYSDIYNLSPRVFEELIADVYKNLGYEVVLTQQSNDGGFDLILLEKNSHDQILVECKRYAPSRKVGVELVRQLSGSMVDKETERSIFVTTSSYTKGALQYTDRLRAGKYGFSIDLAKAEQLLRSVGSYNLSMPLESVCASLISNDNDWTDMIRSRVSVDGCLQPGPLIEWQSE